MNTGLVVFFFVIVVAVIVLACVLAVYVGRNFPSEQFDERQKIARGDAYRFSHWMGMLYWLGLFVHFVMHTGESGWVIEPFLWLIIGILVQLQSFHVYCLITHSALPLGEKPLPTIVSHFVLGGVYLRMYFEQYIPEIAAGAAGISGATSYNLLRLLISLNFFALAVMHLIAYLRKEKEWHGKERSNEGCPYPGRAFPTGAGGQIGRFAPDNQRHREG